VFKFAIEKSNLNTPGKGETRGTDIERMDLID